ncbi:MAG: hydrolase, partial [Bacteroidota bacterium]
TFNADGSFNEELLNLVYFVSFRNSAEARIRIRHNGVKLPFALDLIGDDVFLPAERYDFTEVSGYFATNSRKQLSGDLDVTYGSFYNGTKLTISSNINIRRQPWGNFGIAYTQNRVDLKEFGATDLHLIGPRAEVSFSNKMFWTTFLQYNTQSENFNINSRFQWRYKPMSDIFIVYTDNYTTTDLTVKNRGLVFKMTYWLNI